MRWRSDQAVGIDFDTGGKQKPDHLVARRFTNCCDPSLA